MASLDKKTVVVGCFVAIGLLFAGTAGVASWRRSSAADALAEERSRVEQLQRQLEETTKQAAAPMVETATRWQLQPGPEVVATMQTVQMLGDQAGVVFSSLKALRSADHGRQSFTAAGRGRPDSVCAFLASIEQHDRLMIVETGRLVPAGGGDIGFEIGLATYHGGGN